MNNRKVRCLTLALFTLLGIAVHIGLGQAQQTGKVITPAIPRTWDDQAMASLEVPLADPAGSPVHLSADYYYRIPVRPIYKSYPVYVPGKEPAGYEEWLKRQEPETVSETIFDASKLKTEADWIAAGEIVFDAPASYDIPVRAADVRNPQWHERLNAPTAKDGTLPWFRYVVREKGKVELGTVSCAMCHTRVLADGTIVKGAQNNFPFEQAAALFIRQNFTPERARIFMRSFFGAPWIKPDSFAKLDQLSLEQIAEWSAAIPPGVIGRHGTSPLYPPQVPDLIGVKDQKYLDHTGLQLNRSIADMMRYSALNQGADVLASHGGFIPGARDFRTRPDPSTRLRSSDEQLYALSLYLYSLGAPANPNKFDALARRGQQVFKREGCAVPQNVVTRQSHKEDRIHFLRSQWRSGLHRGDRAKRGAAGRPRQAGADGVARDARLSEEDGVWKLVHRHADPLIDKTAPATILQK